MKNENQAITALREARDEFVSQWGVIGSAWGVNRTMAQIHALLITAPSALSTDEVMAELKISRGNAHRNLRDLVSWRSEEHTSELQSHSDLVCRLLLEKKNTQRTELGPLHPRFR